MTIVAVLVALLPGGEGMRLEPVKRGPIEARLMVRVEESNTKGHAELTLTLEIEGPPLMVVEAPKLDEVNGNWEDERTTWASLNEGRLTWVQVLRLQQTNQGKLPIPALSVRFREDAKAPWSEPV